MIRLISLKFSRTVKREFAASSLLWETGGTKFANWLSLSSVTDGLARLKWKRHKWLGRFSSNRYQKVLRLYLQNVLRHRAASLEDRVTVQALYHERTSLVEIVERRFTIVVNRLRHHTSLRLVPIDRHEFIIAELLVSLAHDVLILNRMRECSLTKVTQVAVTPLLRLDSLRC